jgi:hypothetical protein
VHRIELGPPDSFDRPATTAEALDRLEQRAGPQARAMLEQFLEQVKQWKRSIAKRKAPIDVFDGSPASGATRASEMRLVIFSLQSTAGSLRGSTRAI